MTGGEAANAHTNAAANKMLRIDPRGAICTQTAKLLTAAGSQHVLVQRTRKPPSPRGQAAQVAAVANIGAKTVAADGFLSTLAGSMADSTTAESKPSAREKIDEQLKSARENFSKSFSWLKEKTKEEAVKLRQKSTEQYYHLQKRLEHMRTKEDNIAALLGDGRVVLLGTVYGSSAVERIPRIVADVRAASGSPTGAASRQSGGRATRATPDGLHAAQRPDDPRAGARDAARGPQLAQWCY